MTKSKATNKRPAGAPGAKILITATSLAITLGGWAAFARANTATSDPASSAPEVAIALPGSATGLGLAPALLPTLVPAPALPPNLIIARPPAISAELLNGSVPAAAQARTVPAPAAAAPVAELPAAAPLRAVIAPPQPVARTRSSK
jgi:hypothetical protein